MISYAPLFDTMRSRDITMYALTRKMGFPQSTYYAIKRGENVSIHTINQLCSLLHCNVEDIIRYEED